MVPAALSVTVAGTSAAAPAARRVKVAVVIVAAAMGLLNVALTVVVTGTPVAPFGGAWTVTVGAVSVVKLQITGAASVIRSEEHTSELQSPCNLVCRLLLEKKKKRRTCMFT